LKVHAGTSIKQDEVLDYVRELGYAERPDSVAGSFSISGSTLKINPRSDLFPSVSLAFERGRLRSITSAGQAVDETQLEPLPMRNFIRYLNDDSLKEQRVRRIIIAPGTVPEALADAVTSAEDHRFFDHHGIDIFAIVKRVATHTGGGSSITQQLVKNTIFKGAKEEFWQRYLGFLPNNVQRKLTDVFFALAAEKVMSKDEILAAYLSLVPLGAADGIELDGIATGAKEYFGKNLSELSVAEAATLGGMINRPSYYVTKAREGEYRELIERRNSVLDLMRRNHPQEYSPETIERAKAEPLRFIFSSDLPTDRPAESYSGQFVEFAAAHLPAELAQLQTNEGALQVYTTLDFHLQKQATAITAAAARELQPRIARVCRQQEAKANCVSLQPQIGLIAIEAHTGRVLTMVGGIDSSFNYATAKRSPSSAIKPFFYLRAIERGSYQGKPFTAATLIDPAADPLSGYRPTENIGVKSSARIGLAKSYNFHAVAAAESAGLNQSIDFVARLTSSRPERTGMAAVGGTSGSETSLFDLVQAYSVFPNNGKFVPATFHQAFAQDTRMRELVPTQSAQVADAGAAFVLTQMLRSVVGPQGTARSFPSLAGFAPDAPVAGKSGTGMVADVWFVAFGPHVIIGVWVGLPQNEVRLKMEDGFTGARVAAPIAARFVRGLRRFRPDLLVGDFEPPPNVTSLPIDASRGCLKAQSTVEEYFVVGREPLRCLGN
jgi:penicillin-binding protein 1B